MASEFQTRKLIRRFGLLDDDHGGHVELVDYLRIAERLRCAFGLADDDPRVGGLRAAYETLWKAVHADRSRVSLEEFVVAWATGTEDFDGMLGPVWEKVFDLADEDADGRLDVPELRTVLRAHGLPEPQVEAALRHIAPGGNGLSREEFGRLCRDYFAGDDFDAAGNWLFGDPQPLTAGL